jgi:hypothetical protein
MMSRLINLFKFQVGLIAIVTLYGTIGCIPTNPGVSTGSNIYHKTPQWALSDTLPQNHPDYNSNAYDINDDSIYDFIITQITPGSFGYSSAKILCLNNCIIQGRSQSGTSDSAHFYVPLLNYGELISVQDTFYNNNTIGSKLLFGRTAYDQVVHNYFIGFKLLVNSEFHFAWVRFNDQSLLPSSPLNIGVGTVKILESGYSKLPNTEIKAGEW